MKYDFITHWRLKADQDKVWALLADSSSWPRWWPGMKEVVIQEADEHRQVAKMRVGYLVYFLDISVIFDKVSDHSIVLACTGDLVGGGETSVGQEGGLTVVAISWDVSTTKPWMNALGTMGRPFFSFMHNFVMRQGGVRLAREVKGTLVSNSSILK